MNKYNKRNHIAEENAATDKQQVGTLELLAERAVINKEKILAGKVRISKQIRSKTINVPVELLEEVLTIETSYSSEEDKNLLTADNDNKDVVLQKKSVQHSTASITINGHDIEIGDEPIEIVISREVAIISKETRVIQEIEIKKEIHKYEENIEVELSHEELDIEEDGDLSHR